MFNQTALYDALMEMGVIDKELLDEVFAEAKLLEISFEELLLERDLVTDENLGMLKADVLKVPFIRLERVSLDRDVVMTLPEVMARMKRVLVYGKKEGEINLAMNDPEDYLTLSLIKRRLGGVVTISYATERDLKVAMFAYRREVAEVFEEIIAKSVGEVKGGMENEAPIVRMVETILTYAYQSRASDVHVEAMEDCMMIRFRVDGLLQDVVKLPLSIEKQVINRIRIMASLPTDIHAAAQDGKIVFEIPDVERVDIRVSIVPTTNGEKVVMRLLAGNLRQYALSDLGMMASDIEKVRVAYSKPYGMLLSTGPTGSGKTTTMYSVLKILNRRNVNIMTIEDPVEYEIKGVNQIQVNNQTNLSFAAGLKSIVRQDPNIILVGEIRDEETAGIAVNAALTGHLVLSTLHTNDAATTVPRLLDMGIEPFLISSSVNVVVAQRLVRKICPNCRVGKTMDLTTLVHELHEDVVKKHFDMGSKEITVYYGKGCEVCRKSGYQGRVGIFEVMLIDDRLRLAIIDKKDAEEIKNIAIEQGMSTMVDDGLEKIKMGMTTIDELLRVVKS